MSTPVVQITEAGLFLPRESFQYLGDIEVVHGKHYIIIKPKNLTRFFSGFIKPHVKVSELHEDYELSLLAGE